jgi:hypothetical protein
MRNDVAQGWYHVSAFREGRRAAAPANDLQTAGDEPEIANHAEILLGTKRRLVEIAAQQVTIQRPEIRRNGVVEMDAGNNLHFPAVTVTESAPIDRLHAADVGGAVARQRYLAVLRDAARHARRPQHFVVELRIRELVNVADEAQRFPGGRKSGCHEFEQGLGKIRRDILIGQRGTQADRVRRLRQESVGVDAQRFLLDALEASVHRVAVSGNARQAFLEALLQHDPLGFAR